MAAAAVIGVVMVSAPVAHAADLTIPIDTVIDSGIATGDEADLETVATADLEGATCEVRSVRRDEEQIETNTGNDLVVESGQDATTLEDVEREPGAVTDGSAITLGPTISLTLVMGEDEQFAAGIDIEFDCGLDVVATAAAEEVPPTAESPAQVAEPAGAAAEPAAPTDPGDLPTTGSETAIVSLLGASLLFFGAALVLVSRPPATPSTHRPAVIAARSRGIR